MCDFRKKRKKLSPEDFAICEGIDSGPTDLIDRDTWKSIVSLPDDVSLRTSEHFGTALKILWNLWGDWINIISQGENSSIVYTALIATDDFQASIYNALVGFYRTAYATLRSVIENMSFGLYFELFNKRDEFEQWVKGNEKLKFGKILKNLYESDLILLVENILLQKCCDRLFDNKRGLIRRLYKKLSNFVHSRPGYTHFDSWNSNGPVFVQKEFCNWFIFFLKIYLISLIFIKLGCPQITKFDNGTNRTIKDLFEEVLKYLPENDLDKNLLSVINEIICER